MNKSIVNLIDGGYAIYVGVGSLFAFIGGLIMCGTVVYNAYANPERFAWWMFALALSITIISGFIAYLLLQVGFRTLEENVVDDQVSDKHS